MARRGARGPKDCGLSQYNEKRELSRDAESCTPLVRVCTKVIRSCKLFRRERFYADNEKSSLSAQGIWRRNAVCKREIGIHKTLTGDCLTADDFDRFS